MTANCTPLGAHVEPPEMLGGAQDGREDDEVVHLVLVVPEKATPRHVCGTCGRAPA
ncbi:hypothetical protein [Streptomyces sp. NPDC046870]|uniref:hypothetical protein n=1 Tax=Streptomyces sp. NPDC046870 TaxID=3155135 RepID=UPI00345376D9